jgi:thioredoxin reductase
LPRRIGLRAGRNQEAKGESVMIERTRLPVAIIGAGPIGLAAAAHLIRRGIPVRIFEAGGQAGSNVEEWGHVHLFSPWKYNVDEASRQLLAKSGWRDPDPEVYPTGDELVERYVKPLASTPEIASVIELNARVTAVSRAFMDKVTTKGRQDRPFSLKIASANGETKQVLARAVIDASGTWGLHNPLGADGLPAIGELRSKDRIAYGIPDVLGPNRTNYENQSVLVVGAGHSAANALIDLVKLQENAPRTRVTWVTRSNNLQRVYGGGDADQLEARGALGSELHSLVDSGTIKLIAGFRAAKISETNGSLALSDADNREIGPFTRVIVATGQRPDVSFLREIRLSIDTALECATALAPLIDPNVHSCGSVRPHGYKELSHPEPDFYTVGVKSYGRAPTFLLLTGYEQSRSVAAAISGDTIAANEVNLILPETGVCSTSRSATSEPQEAACCGGPALVVADACCAKDEEAKLAKKSGCGCSTTTQKEGALV